MSLITFKFKPESLRKQTTVQVLLPSLKTFDSQLKTLWLLHGMGDDQNAWIQRTTIDQLVEKYRLCVVCPNADLSFYADMAFGGKYFTFLSEELPEYLRQFLPITEDKQFNFIAGNSMGGYGAFLIAMNCPNRFHAAYSLSGPMYIDWIYKVLSNAELAKIYLQGEQVEIEKAAQDFSEQNDIPKPLIESLLNISSDCTAAIFMAMFGINAQLKGSRYDIPYLAQQLIDHHEKLTLSAYCGKQDYHYTSNRLFNDKFNHSALDYTFHTGEGTHNWDYWDNQIREVFEQISAVDGP
jgi:S-formylglutathione hydrolase FrmB